MQKHMILWPSAAAQFQTENECEELERLLRPRSFNSGSVVPAFKARP